MKPEVKLIHRIIALPIQIIGLLFFAVFFLAALISAPHRAKKLFKAIKEGLNTPKNVRSKTGGKLNTPGRE